MARKDYGDPKSWDWSYNYDSGIIPRGWANKYIVPYVKEKSHKCDRAWDRCLNSWYTKCYNNGNCNGHCNNEGCKINDYIILNDGATLGFHGGGYNWSANDPWVWITIDLNGDKKPNIYGRDIFNLFFYAKKGFASNNWVSCANGTNGYKSNKCNIADYIRQNGRNAAIYQCKTNPIATYCADLIILNGWKIPDDYPW